MTHDAPNGPEERTAPPAVTRWQEDPVPDDGGPLPPFIPARSRKGDDAPPTPAAQADAAADRTLEAEPAASTVEPEPAGAVEGGFPFELGEPEAPEPAPSAAEPPTEEDFPMEAFDIEGEGEPARAASDGPTPAERVAERLERLAAGLRSEGAAAVEAEMASPDQLSSLLAAVLAGYLAGVRE